MKKEIKLVILALFFLCYAPAALSNAESTVHYQVVNYDTLEVSGTGELKKIPTRFSWKTEGRSIRKLVIKSGFTKISSSVIIDLDGIEEIILPDTLTEIEYGAFSECDCLKEIIIPDSVKVIGSDAFANCKRLETVVLPAALAEWDESILEGCPSLKKIDNHSNIECKVPWYKKYVTWKVGGKKVTSIPAKKVATAKGKKVRIQYDLMGGRATEKLPDSYRFGTEIQLPKCVKRKGYVFMGWCTYMDDSVTRVGPNNKKVKLYANWYKYQIISNKKGQAEISFDSRESATGFLVHLIRYSQNSDMKSSKKVYCSKKNGKIQIRNLEPGKIYYFQISGVSDLDRDFDIWFGKRKVSVSK